MSDLMDELRAALLAEHDANHATSFGEGCGCETCQLILRVWEHDHASEEKHDCYHANLIPSARGGYCCQGCAQLFDVTIRKPDPVPGRCGLCGNLMPEGEEMFKYHGYSGGCPEAAVRQGDE